MTTKETDPQTTETEAVGDPEPKVEVPAQLREAKDRSDARADKYRKELVEVRLGQIGLSAEEGLGIAIAEGFKGDPTLEEISAFAKDKYKYESTGSNQMQTQGGVLTPAEQHQLEADQNAGIMNQARSVTPTNETLEEAQKVDKQYVTDGSDVVGTREIEQGISAKMNAFRT